MPLPMSPQAEDLLRMIPGLFQPSAPASNPIADRFSALGQQWMSDAVPEFTGQMPGTPQSVLTQDNELRQFGAEPAPQMSPHAIAIEQMLNEQQVAIPNLEAKQYQNYGDTRPPGGSYIGTSQGYFMPPSKLQPGRDVNELRMLDAQNKQSQGDGGILGMLQSAIMGPQQPQNQLSQQEQMMVDALAKDEAQRQATMEQRQGLVTQRAQQREATQDFQQDPNAAMFAQLTQALKGQGQGQSGPPPAILQMINPQMYKTQMDAFQAQQQLGQGDRRLNMLEQENARAAAEGTRQFDVSTGLAREGLTATQRQHDDKMALEREKNDPFGLGGPTPPGAPTDPDRSLREDARLRTLGASDEDLLERDKQAGVLTPRAQTLLEAEYKAAKPLIRNPMMIGSPVNQYYDNQKFIEKMTAKRWPPALLQQFLEQTGRAVEKPNYPGPKDRSNAEQPRSWLFPGF